MSGVLTLLRGLAPLALAWKCHSADDLRGLPVKRDMDLIRKILLTVEENPSDSVPRMPTLSGWSDDTVAYHLVLLKEAGFVDGTKSSAMGRPTSYMMIRLTWPGHEFLDAARDDTVWNKAKATIGAKITSVSMDVLIAVLTSITKAQLGIT